MLRGSVSIAIFHILLTFHQTIIVGDVVKYCAPRITFREIKYVGWALHFYNYTFIALSCCYHRAMGVNASHMVANDWDLKKLYIYISSYMHETIDSGFLTLNVRRSPQESFWLIIPLVSTERLNHTYCPMHKQNLNAPAFLDGCCVKRIESRCGSFAQLARWPNSSVHLSLMAYSII